MPPTPPPTPPPTQPPTPPPTRPAPSGPVDPFNCAVDAESTWAADKKEWCCRIHHRGCPPTAPPPFVPVLPPVMPTAPPPPADPYNCAEGWPIGWLDGVSQRRSGVAGCMARAAQARAVEAVSRPLSHMIAMLVSPIGWLDGVSQRRSGAARMKAGAALQQEVAAHELDLVC